jgi:hypothetical protein
MCFQYTMHTDCNFKRHLHARKYALTLVLMFEFGSQHLHHQLVDMLTNKLNPTQGTIHLRPPSVAYS